MLGGAGDVGGDDGGAQQVVDRHAVAPRQPAETAAEREAAAAHLTSRIEQIDKEKAKRLAAAALPIPGIAMAGDVVTFDDGITGPVELMPGVYCDAANAHTEGSMNIHVHTADGIATICGDVIYDFNDQIVTPFNEIHDAEPRTTGNHGTI